MIRADDPSAEIVIGAGAGVWSYGYPGYGNHRRYSMNLEYLKAVFRSRVVARVDVLTWHGIYGSRADDPYYRGYPRTVAGLIAVARAAGFGGRFLAAEMQWRQTVDPPDNNMLRLPERQAVKYFLRTSVLHRGLGIITVIAPTGVHQPDRLISKALRALNNLLAGAEPAPLARSVQTKAAPFRSASFQRGEGDRLLVVWTDGLPRTSDPGTPATLTLGGLGAYTAVASDPLRVKEQKLITSRKNGALVIRNLLVRDYPIFIQLTRP